MRSRFSAYALGEIDYLWRTLDPEHPERARSAAEHAAAIRAARRTLRYVRLRVFDREEDPVAEAGRVLFHAELYEAGKERSFLELSSFRRRADGWRYHSGKLAVAKADDPRLAGLTLGTFEERFPGAD